MTDLINYFSEHRSTAPMNSFASPANFVSVSGGNNGSGSGSNSSCCVNLLDQHRLRLVWYGWEKMS
jgi:hypothetical protein